ncbi:MAG: hypothetical protein LBQ96_00290, partial [Fusobacteriaceae bacterium]|nr:hypothetical protein [Fusobacteriaceae bacterium]
MGNADTVWFVLKKTGEKYYILPYDQNKNKIERLDELQGDFDETTRLILEELRNFKGDEFFIDWGESEGGDFCLNDYTEIL